MSEVNNYKRPKYQIGDKKELPGGVDFDCYRCSAKNTTKTGTLAEWDVDSVMITEVKDGQIGAGSLPLAGWRVQCSTCGRMTILNPKLVDNVVRRAESHNEQS